MVLPSRSRITLGSVAPRILQRVSSNRCPERRLRPEFLVFRPCLPRLNHTWNSTRGDVSRSINVPIHHPALGADGQLVRGMRDLGAAFIAQLRRVGRIYGYDPAAIPRHVVSQPPDKSASVPPAVLHRVSDPAQIFHRNDGAPTRGTDRLSPGLQESPAHASSGTRPRGETAPRPARTFWLAGGVGAGRTSF